MNFLLISLIFVLALSILITYFSLHPKRTAIEVVNDMGMGWNLGNTFDCFNKSIKLKYPDDQITLWGNVVPTKEMVVGIKKYGFKTIRFPITWMAFMDESGNVDPNWMARVKEVVDWITKDKIYCIINLHHDGAEGNWLSKGLKSKNKFINLWSQIANEFKDYDEHLIFESMNEVDFRKDGVYDYITLLILNQAFVDVIRNSGGNNGERLLLISGARKDIDLTFSKEYKLPIDPSNKFAISMCYYVPQQFALEEDDNLWTWIDDDGIMHEVPSMTEWGTESHYKDMFANFEAIKETYPDKGIPIIFSEIGVLTEQKKDPKSIRRFLFAGFSMSVAYSGIMSCLWDTSKKGAGDMNYYDKENDKWYDEKLRDIFQRISKGDYVNPKNYYIESNIETVNSPNASGNMNIRIGKKKAIKSTFNIKLLGEQINNISFEIESNDRYGNIIKEEILGSEGKRRYDGTYTYNVDIAKREYYNYIEIHIVEGEDYISFNYFSIEFNQKYTFFDYNSYIKNIS